MIGSELIQALDRSRFLDTKLVYETGHSCVYPFCLWIVHKNKTVSVTLAQPSRATKTDKFYLLNKNQQGALFFLNLFEQSILYMFRIE